MCKLNFKTFFAIVVAFLLCMSPLMIQADQGAYTIEDYDVQSVYHKNNTITTQETIKVNFTSPRHGIYRDIPLNMYVGYSKDEDPSQKKKAERYKIQVKDIKVSGDAYESSSEDGVKRIQIGDADEYVEGEHTYHISYTLVIPEDYRKDYDFIYYSPLGSYWNTTIDHFQFNVRFEKALTQKEINNLHVLSGDLGNEDNALSIDYSLDAKGISGQASNIASNQAITLYGKVRKNYFVGAKKANALPAWICAILALIFAMMALIQNFRVKKERVTPIVSFYPPEHLDPAAVGYLVDVNSDIVDLMALIPYWASKGYLSISEKNEKVTVHKEKEIEEELPLYQEMIWQGLFKENKKCSISKLPKRFIKKLEAAQKALENEYTGEKELTDYDWGLIWTILMLPLMTLMVLFNSKVALFTGIGLLQAGIFLILTCAACVLSYKNCARQTFSNKKSRILKYVLITPMLLFSFFIVYYQSTQSTNILPQPLLFAILLIFIFVVYRMDRFSTPTVYWIEKAGPLLGFKEFIQKAELDQLERLSSENPSYYYDVIPYAMVFGLSKTWTQKFETIQIEQPSWYHTSSSDPYSTWMYYSMLDQGIRQSAQTRLDEYQAEQMKSTASSSSSSFGGFSGGGAGGGGGGSW